MTTPKYLFVTGGVASSLGKGVVAASIALLLERRGLTVAIQKIDPYLNLDPGTMNPGQHGEVYVLEDGTETDLDLGHYERFCATRLTRAASTTMGRIYQRVLDRERKGDYLGQTVQVVPHVVGELKAAIVRADADVVITEIGGTVGDIEGQPVLEAVRQLVHEVGHANAAVVHLTLLPFIAAAGELKTKPTQHSVMELRRVGLRPDILVCRVPKEGYGLSTDEVGKLAMFCDVTAERVFVLPDTNPIYAVPLDLYDGGMNAAVCERLGLCPESESECGRVNLDDWRNYVRRSRSRYTLPVARVAMVGKYDHQDAYKSIAEALEHAGLAAGVRVDVTVVEAELFDGSAKDAGFLTQFDGVLVPGGFGSRGVAGKVHACKVARECGVPYFGICLGLQIAVIEAARNLCGWRDANSTEFDPKTPHPVVSMLHEQRDVSDKGGTMRLGTYPAAPLTGTKVAAAYGVRDGASVSERHRHRYEINGVYPNALDPVGLVPAATGLGGLVEAMERTDHPWFVGVQYHPEFNSRPTAPHPLFIGFVKAAGCRAARAKAASARPCSLAPLPAALRPIGPLAPGSIFAPPAPDHAPTTKETP